MSQINKARGKYIDAFLISIILIISILFLLKEVEAFPKKTNPDLNLITINEPISVAIGDLNNDKLNDIAVSNFKSNNINIYFQQKNFTFPKFANLSFDVGNKPSSIVIGDLNNDSLNDVAVANSGSNNITIFYQNPNSFTSFNLITEDFPIKLDVGDLNNDSLDDIAVVNYNSNSLLIFHQKLDNTFNSIRDKKLNTGDKPCDIVISDLNNDKENDIAILNFYSNDIWIYYQPFDNESIKIETKSNPRAIAVNDLNNDTLNDIVITTDALNQTQLYFQNDTGIDKKSEIFFAISDEPFGLCIGDLANNELNEIAIATSSDNKISIFYQPFFKWQNSNITLTTDDNPRSIAIGDVNTDGYNDIVVANKGSNTISVFYQETLPPIANISSPKNNETFTDKELIYFDGKNSSNVEDFYLCFSWYSNISGFFGNTSQFYKKLDIGVHNITLFVDDKHGNNVSTSKVIKIIKAKNFPPIPIINLPLNHSIYNSTDEITFNCKSSYDLDNDTLKFFWYSNISGYLGNFSQFKSKLKYGEHNITLYVNDSHFNVSVWINIKILNSPPIPIINSPKDKDEFVVSEIISFDASSSYDPDNDILGFTWFSDKIGFLGFSKQFNSNLLPGKHVITLFVDDEHAHNVSRSIIILIKLIKSPEGDNVVKPDTDGTDSNTNVLIIFDSPLLAMKRWHTVDSVKEDYTMYVENKTKIEIPSYNNQNFTYIYNGILWFKIDVSPKKFTSIPSVSPDSKILGYTTDKNDVKINFYKDSADNYYVSSNKKANIVLEYSMGTNGSYFNLNIDENLTVNDMPNWVLKTPPDYVLEKGRWFIETHLPHLKNEKKLKKIVDNLTKYFSSFTCGEGDVPEPSGEYDIYQTIAINKIGACRHRSFAFFVTANVLGLPTRYVWNEVHAFVEVYIPKKGESSYNVENWKRIDLGGCGSSSVIPPSFEKIGTKISIIDVQKKAEIGKNFWVSGKVTDSNGNAIFNIPVEIYLNNTKLCKWKTNINGEFNITCNVPSNASLGINVVSAHVNSTILYERSSSLPFTIEIFDNAIPLIDVQKEVYKGNTFWIKGNIKGNLENISNYPFELYLNNSKTIRLGKWYSNKSSDFLIKLKVPNNINVGKYSIICKALEKDYYNSKWSNEKEILIFSTTNLTFEANETMKVTSFQTIRGYLYDFEKIPIKNEKIDFFLDNIYLGSVVTNEKGYFLFKFQVAEEFKNGKKIKVIFNGTKFFSPSNLSKNITIISFTEEIDLEVINITFSDQYPIEKNFIKIFAKIKNNGKTSARDILVSFYIDRKLIENITVTLINSTEIKKLVFGWRAIKGNHTIKIIVNENKKIKESNFKNNEMQIEIFVKEAKEEKEHSLLIYLIILALIILPLSLFVLFKKQIFRISADKKEIKKV